MTEKSGIFQEMESEVILEWYEEYQSMDELITKLDLLRCELDHLRHLVEQKMADVDRLFNPYVQESVYD